MKKKINVFGKQISIWIAAMVVLMIGVSAVLLPYFGQKTETIEVTQPITVTGDTEYTIEDAMAGETVLGSLLRITNDADWDIDVGLTTTETEGIETSYVGKLDMTTKDTSTWAATDDLKAELYYTIVGNEFRYVVNSESDLSNYIAVYYPDVNEAKDWNIANAVIIGDANDEWTVSDLNGDLPDLSDYNLNPNEGDSYCNEENGFDSYEHCNGAKIWLMPESEFGSWSPNEWLFETDLIRHNSDDKLTIPAGSYIEFYTLFDLDSMLATDDYTMTTTVDLYE